LIEATFNHAIETELEHAAALATDPSSYIDAAGQYLPIDDRRRDAAKIWIAFYAMVLCDEGRIDQRTARCHALRKVMVEGLRAFHPLSACHDIVDRIFVLVDGIAINALLDTKRWTRDRQRTVLREGIEDVFARH
jgi:hypothetical protein